MELKDRDTTQGQFSKNENRVYADPETIPDFEEEVGLEPAFFGGFAEDQFEFRPDEVYLQAFRVFQADQKRLEAEKKARREAERKTRDQKEAANHPAGQGSFMQKSPDKNLVDYPNSGELREGNRYNGNRNQNGNGTGNSSPRPKSSKVENQLNSNFTGLHFPQLNIETLPTTKYELVTDSVRLHEIIDLLILEPVLAVDTETNGLDPYNNKLLLVQVASPEKCYIIDATKVNLGPLARLFENEKSLKLLQNAKFDYKMLKQQANLELKNVYDTYLAERLLTAGLQMEVNLAAITKRYLDEVMDKSVRKTFYGANSVGHVSDEQLAYAARDVEVLFPIYCKQLVKLKENKLLAVADLEFKCVAAVGDLELAGCKLDVEKWRQILAKVEKQRDAVRTELMEMLPSGSAKQSSMFGSDEYLINLNSQHQIMAEFNKLGIKLEGTSEQELNRAFTEHKHPALKKLLEYRGLEKTLGSFGEGLLSNIHKKTGRIHPDFLQYGADTGRFSCSNPNVQQIPQKSDFRSCFITEEGYKMVICDYSQAELRILAELSGDPAFINAFVSGGDLHKLAASQMFQVAIEDVSKDQRSAAKAINFGLAYGMGPQGLALRIDKTVEESRALIEAYFKAFSGVQKWLEKAGKDSVRLRYSPTPLGRKRFYKLPERDDPDYRRKVSEVERQGKNAPIQGCNADMTKMALVFLREKLKGYDARIVNCVHDEIVVEVREDQAEVVCKIVEAEMIRAGKEILKLVPIVADAKVDSTWSK